MKLLGSLAAILKNKYLITGLAFIVWMLFFDSDDVTSQWKRINELKQLQQSEKDMSNQIADTKKELELLKTNPSTLERYARETYMMKRDNEDLFIVDHVRKNTK
jgi:cell division protein DivIC